MAKAIHDYVMSPFGSGVGGRLSSKLGRKAEDGSTALESFRLSQPKWRRGVYEVRDDLKLWGEGAV
jgi:hypothetical protein